MASFQDQREVLLAAKNALIKFNSGKTFERTLLFENSVSESKQRRILSKLIENKLVSIMGGGRGKTAYYKVLDNVSLENYLKDDIVLSELIWPAPKLEDINLNQETQFKEENKSDENISDRQLQEHILKLLVHLTENIVYIRNKVDNTENMTKICFESLGLKLD